MSQVARTSRTRAGIDLARLHALRAEVDMIHAELRSLGDRRTEARERRSALILQVKRSVSSNDRLSEHIDPRLDPIAQARALPPEVQLEAGLNPYVWTEIDACTSEMERLTARADERGRELAQRHALQTALETYANG